MNVEILKTVASPDGVMLVGRVYDVPTAKAKRLISSGVAVSTVKPKPSKTAAKKSEEKSNG